MRPDSEDRPGNGPESKFEERMLDVALEEIIGDVSPPDLTERVLAAAAERSAAQSAPGGVDRRDEFAPHRETRVTPRRLPGRSLAIAATILLVATLSILFALRDDSDREATNESLAENDRGMESVPDTDRASPGDPKSGGIPPGDPQDPRDPAGPGDPVGPGDPTQGPQFAIFADAMVGLRGEELEPYEAGSAVVGDLFVNTGPDATTIAFGRSDRMRMKVADRTVFAFESRTDPIAVRVLNGTIDIETGDSAWIVTLPDGEVRIEPESRGTFAVDAYVPPALSDSFGRDPRGVVRAVRKSRSDSLVRIQEGQAAGVFREVETSLVAGEEVSVWFGQPPVTGASLSESERYTLEGELASIRMPLEVPELSTEYHRLSQRADRNAEALRLRLADWPAAWNFLRPQLYKVLEGESKSDRYRAYAILFDDPHPWTRGMLEENADPDLWDPDILMQLATRGAKFAMERLRIWVRARSPELEEQVYAALFLAIRDEPAGARVLRRAAESKGEFLRDSNAFFASAAGLALLGEPEAWRRGVAYLREEAERITPREGLESTDVRVLRAAYFQRTLSGEAIDLTSMDDPVLDFIDTRRNALQDPAALRQAIEALPNPLAG